MTQVRGEYPRRPLACGACRGNPDYLRQKSIMEIGALSRSSAERLAEGLAYRDDSLTKHLMHLPSQKFIE